MAGSWKYEGDLADKADEEGDEKAFSQAPTPEDFEAEPYYEGEEADANCEGVIRHESPQLWEDGFAPVRGRSRMEFPELRSGDSTEQSEPYLAKPRSFMNRPTTAWNGERKACKLVKPDEMRVGFSPQGRLLILDACQRSGLPAGDFAPLVGFSKHTLYLWKKRFTEQGHAGLMENPRGARPGSNLSEVTKRTIVMLKQAHPDWGCQRISDELLRGPALAASASAVARVLHEAGYVMEERRTEPHPDKVRRFERAKPNQLWQTDLFTFVMKRQNRLLFLVPFMDDHSRYLVGYGLHASASTALVLEVVRAAVANYGPPEEILTDNGPQYVTWRVD